MLRKNRYILILLLVFMISIATFAIRNPFAVIEAPKSEVENTEAVETTTDDDPWHEIEQLVANYYNKNGVWYEGTMRLIDETGSEQKTLEDLSFQYTLFGNEYHYVLGAVEIISRKDLLMAVDHDSKSVVLNLQQHARPMSQSFDPMLFKTLLTHKHATVRVSILGDEKIVTVDNIDDATVQGYRIYYDANTYQLRKIEIGMVRFTSLEDEKDGINEQADGKDEVPAYTYFLEVNYRSVKRLDLKKGAFHPEYKFLKTEGKIKALTPEFSGYSLVNAAG